MLLQIVSALATFLGVLLDKGDLELLQAFAEMQEEIVDAVRGNR